LLSYQGWGAEGNKDQDKKTSGGQEGEGKEEKGVVKEAVITIVVALFLVEQAHCPSRCYSTKR